MSMSSSRASSTAAGHVSVAIPMLTLVPGGMGGSETYARELLRSLADFDGLSVESYVPPTAAGFSAGVPEVIIDSVSPSSSLTDRVLNLVKVYLAGRAIRARFVTADVVHYPFTVMLPGANRGQATVQTLLDVQHLELPALFSRAELEYRRVFYERAARRADVIVTISEFAKRRMVELLGLAEDRVIVAHLGVDASAFTPNTGERENVILYPARGWQHKNHARLIEAVEMLRRDDPALRLILTGGGLESLGELPSWVDRRGLVSEDELRDLYRSAGVLAFPSLYEGFGLPPLEAMASGCPVAASDAGSIPEVVGDAAVLFDPRDTADIARGISDALRRRAELSSRGVEHARRFTWDACAARHAEAYRLARDVRQSRARMG